MRVGWGIWIYVSAKKEILNSYSFLNICVCVCVCIMTLL